MLAQRMAMTNRNILRKFDKEWTDVGSVGAEEAFFNVYSCCNIQQLVTNYNGGWRKGGSIAHKRANIQFLW